MLIRIVRMHFEEDQVDTFLAIFDRSVDRIRQSQGCREVRLKRDAQLPHVYFTHSIWESEEDLNAYRESAFFRETWAATKKLFAGKPQAFSLIEP